MVRDRRSVNTPADMGARGAGTDKPWGPTVLRSTLAASLLVLAGCMVAQGITEVGDMEPPPTTWISTHERDHPLAGRIWRPDEQTFADAASVVAALAGADFVLIGEKHDNPDHHRLQAWLVSALIAHGRRPALAFEMLTGDQVPALSTYLAEHPDDAGGLGTAVGWNARGWPDWAQYAPIAQAALDAGLPVVAADLAKPTVREVARLGVEALEPALRARLDIDWPLEEAMRAAMAAEMRESHCDMLPAEMAVRMVTVQRARDAHMASILVDGADRPSLDGAVLITGTGHGRRDRGVPWHLARMAPGRSTVTIALLETREERTDPSAYAEQTGTPTLPFDFVWFTPRWDLEDPCQKYREQLEGLKDKT